MAISPEEQVSKSWVHEPEKQAGRRTNQLRRIARIADVPSAAGGIALLLLGRRMRGVSGRAMRAAGTTLAVTAAGRLFNRYALNRLRAAPEAAS